MFTKPDTSMSADAAMLSISGLLVEGSPRASSYPVLSVHALVVLQRVYAMTVHASVLTKALPFHAKHTGTSFLLRYTNRITDVFQIHVTLRYGAIEQFVNKE